MLTKSEITYFKTHKSEITPELLDVLRTTNEGKLQALEILETPKNDENFYIDAYGNSISYNGDRALKKAFTQLELSKIHEIEIEKCMNDIFYFLDFYVRILTPKGVDFPEVRQYQRDFLNVISPIENENIIATMPRQSGKSVTVGIFLAHCFLFKKDINIGILANKGSMAREFLDKVKKILVNLPIWLQTGIVTWNKGSIEGESNIRILTDTPSDSSFRGFTCLEENEKIRVFDKKDKQFKTITFKELYENCEKI